MSAKTRITLSMPADAAERLRKRLATMTPAQISEAFGVDVTSYKIVGAVEIETTEGE